MCHHRACLRLLLIALIAATGMVPGCSRPAPAPEPGPAPAQHPPAEANGTASAQPAAPTPATDRRKPPVAPTPATRRAAATATPPPTQALTATLDLSLTSDANTLFDQHLDTSGQEPYHNLFDLRPRPRERRFSVSGDLFWDEEKLKQEEVDYLDALKGGEISIEVKTP